MDHVEIVPYDSGWPASFEAERRALGNALAQQDILAIEHFGSTAVPGLSAKPVIDILVAVPSVEVARGVFPPLLDPHGYDFWADNPKRDRLFFVKGMPPRGARRTHHVHVCERPGEMWDRLLFRDYLRRHPKAAAEYEATKQGLAEKFRDDREAYTEAKSQFIERAMHLARR